MTFRLIGRRPGFSRGGLVLAKGSTETKPRSELDVSGAIGTSTRPLSGETVLAARAFTRGEERGWENTEVLARG